MLAVSVLVAHCMGLGASLQMALTSICEKDDQCKVGRGRLLLSLNFEPSDVMFDLAGNYRADAASFTAHSCFSASPPLLGVSLFACFFLSRV